MDLQKAGSILEAFPLKMGLTSGKHLDWFISRYYQASEIYNSYVVNLSCSVLYFHESKSETETVQRSLHISSPSFFPDLFRLYLLLAEFSVRTVNHGPSFFPSIYGPRASRGSVIYSTDRKNEANKMFIMWLLPVWETGNKCRTSAGRTI